jgi:hypothetical protein
MQRGRLFQLAVLMTVYSSRGRFRKYFLTATFYLFGNDLQRDPDSQLANVASEKLSLGFVVTDACVTTQATAAIVALSF